MLRTILFVSALASVSALVGCTASTGSSAVSSDDALRENDLSALTVVKGEISANASMKIAYEPSEYDFGAKLPYLAVKLVAKPTAPVSAGAVRAKTTGTADLVVTVQGAFPGRPHLLVVDPTFHILAQADGAPSEDGASATVALPASEALDGNNMILVQDPGWVRPMEFELSTGL